LLLRLELPEHAPQSVELVDKIKNNEGGLKMQTRKFDLQARIGTEELDHWVSEG
jgi:hypothetical protein